MNLRIILRYGNLETGVAVFYTFRTSERGGYAVRIAEILPKKPCNGKMFMNFVKTA